MRRIGFRIGSVIWLSTRQTLATNWLRVLITLKLMSQLMMIMIRKIHQTRLRMKLSVCRMA